MLKKYFMKITIDNQEFEETTEIYPISDGLYYKNKWYKPVEKFKVGDWITFWSEIDKTFYTSKIREWSSHSYCKLNNGLEPFKHLLKKATSQEILEHFRTIAKEKGLVKGARVKRINEVDKGAFVTIVQEDDDYYPESDEYAKSGIILYSNGKWVEKIEEPKFTFGGYEVTFKVVSSGEKYNFKTVEINCKGETGTHHQLANILTHYFRPMPFGKVFVKKWLPKKATYIDVHLGLNTFAANDDLANVEEVTIGCLTGKYKELVDIFNHCQKLLK